MSCSCHHNQPASCHHLNNHTGDTVLRHWRVKIERRLWCCHRKQGARTASDQSDNQGAVSASNFVSKPSWAELRMAVEVMMIGAGVTASTADCHPCLHCSSSPALSFSLTWPSGFCPPVSTGSWWWRLHHALPCPPQSHHNSSHISNSPFSSCVSF